jgi:esterase/lipase superfamily enzyme
MNRRSFILLSSASIAGACSRPENLIGSIDASSPASELATLKRHRLLIATNRRPSTNPLEAFSGQRGSGLLFSAIDVSIPPGHVAGRVEMPRHGAPDPRRHFVIHDARNIGSPSGFQRALGKELSRRPHGRRNAVLFVHGYRQTLSSAILHLAQFVEDSGYDGVPVLFSWPSNGRRFDYLYDLNSAILSRNDFLKLNALKNVPELESYEIFAHSMGNVVVMEALRQRALTGPPLSSTKLNGIVLASPDIDFDLFREQLTAIPDRQRNFVVLTSRDDAALGLSQRLAGGRIRVGRAHPEALAALGVSVIDLSAVDDETSTHHSKFQDSPELVRLIGTRMLSGDQFGRHGGNSVIHRFSVGVGETVEVFGNVFGN